METTLEAPSSTIPARKDKPWLFTSEKAKEYSLKGNAVRKAKALARKQRRRQVSIEAVATPDLDPIADLEQRISVAAKNGSSAVTLDRLASALAKLKRHPTTRKQSSPAPCVVDATTNSVPLEPIKPSTPQVSQAVDSNIQATQANFAQYTNALIGEKESLSQVDRGGGVPLVQRRANSGKSNEKRTTCH